MSVEIITEPSAKTTTSFAVADVPTGAEYISILANVTAVSGAGATMALALQWSHDGVNYGPSDIADSFTNITTAVARVKRFEVKGTSFRLFWTLTGTTPSFTFGATVFAVDD